MIFSKFVIIGILFSKFVFSEDISYIDEGKAHQILEEWNNNDPEYDASEDDKEEGNRAIYEKRREMGHQPQMAVITMKPGVDYTTVDKISKVWEINLKNMYIPVSRFSLSLFNLDLLSRANLKNFLYSLKTKRTVKKLRLMGNPTCVKLLTTTMICNSIVKVALKIN
ncbi:hypothetical protein HZS_2906 [Henneguya salminicola]|nr:hypothetical protein HZS_2906 [Henneguya salminicola]